MKKLLLISMMIALVFNALALSKKTPVDLPIDFTEILKGQHSLGDTAAVYLIVNDKDWANLWQTAQGEIEPMPEVTPVDFDKYMILGVFLGRRSSSGYSVEISKLSQSDSILTIDAIEHKSGGGMMLTVMTNPFQIVQIPKGNYKININWTEKIVKSEEQ